MPNDGTAPRGDGHTVLFITNTPGYGGTEKHLLELLRRLAQCGVHSIVLCAGTDPYSGRLDDRHRGLVSVRSEKNLNTTADWLGVFRKIKPDAAMFVYGTLLQHPWYVTVAARLAGIRKLYAIQQLIPPPLPPEVEVKSPGTFKEWAIGKRRRRILSARLQSHLYIKTICVSDAVRHTLVSDYGFPLQKTLTIHNGVSTAEFIPSVNDGEAVRAALGIHKDDFVLVCAARLSEEKGIDILLSALRELLNRNLECKCIIVGDGDLRESLSSQIRALNLTEHVFMVGFQSDIRPYLLAANAFVLTSYKEGLPLAVLEAMACGLPCVVTNVGGNAEAVAHNVSGLVINPGSVGEVVDAISSLLRQPQERERMSRMARSKACEQFDMEARLADITKLILV